MGHNTQSAQTVREDFDGLAALSEEEGWDHSAHYHPFLLGQLPGAWTRPWR